MLSALPYHSYYKHELYFVTPSWTPTQAINRWGAVAFRTCRAFLQIKCLQKILKYLKLICQIALNIENIMIRRGITSFASFAHQLVRRMHWTFVNPLRLKITRSRDKKDSWVMSCARSYCFPRGDNKTRRVKLLNFRRWNGRWSKLTVEQLKGCIFFNKQVSTNVPRTIFMVNAWY